MECIIDELVINEDAILSEYDPQYNNKLADFKDILTIYNNCVQLLGGLIEHEQEIEECHLINSYDIEKFTFALQLAKLELVRYGTNKQYKTNITPLFKLKKKVEDTYRDIQRDLDVIEIYIEFGNIAAILQKAPYNSKLTIYDILDTRNNGYGELLNTIEYILDNYDIEYIANGVIKLDETRIVDNTNKINNALGTKFNPTVIILVLLIMNYELCTLDGICGIIEKEKVKILEEFNGCISSEALERIQKCSCISHLMNYNLLLVMKFTGKIEDGRWPESSIQYDISNSFGETPLINRPMIQKMNLISANEINGVTIDNLVILELLRRVIVEYMNKVYNTR